MEKIAIVGLGTMGSAIENLLRDDYQVKGIGRCDSPHLIEDADAVILAVKPQQFSGGVAEELWPHVHGQLFISIMAGVKVRRLSRLLGTDNVVRTMPNLALATGNSLTAWYTESQGVEEQSLQTLLDKWGKSIRLKREKQFDPFTALAGSGPAYFFRLARIMTEKALSYDFTPQQARQIATCTFLGAASVVGPDTDYGEQTARVASRGGTTEAAMNILDQRDYDGSVGEAIDVACLRSEELGRD